MQMEFNVEELIELMMWGDFYIKSAPKPELIDPEIKKLLQRIRDAYNLSFPDKLKDSNE